MQPILAAAHVSNVAFISQPRRGTQRFETTVHVANGSHEVIGPVDPDERVPVHGFDTQREGTLSELQ